MDVLAAGGLLLALLCIASPAHRFTRQLTKGWLADITIKQLPWVAAAQTYSSRPLDLAVLISAATITLEVYLTLLPLLIWSGYAHFAITGLLPQLALSGYVVFAIKDLLESPRPGDCLKAAPHVQITVRDPSGDVEDGVPSAHCCGAVALLYYGIHAATAAGLLSGQATVLAHIAAASWVLWLAWGRAYLGLHTPLDLATGSLLGFCLLRLWLAVQQPYTAWLEASVQQHQQPWQLPLQVLLVTAVLMRCYPLPTRWTSCYNYATAWAAGWAGCTTGWGLVQQGVLPAANAAASGPGEWLFGGSVPPHAAKVLLGLGLLATTKVLVKALLVVVLKQLFPFVPYAIRCAWQPPVVGAVQQPPAHKQQQQSRQQKGKAASSSMFGGLCGGLRHTPEGVGNDVVATARWCSYFALGFTVSAWNAVWPLVLARLAPSSSIH